MLIKYAQTNRHLLFFCVLFQLKFFIKSVAGWTEESPLLKHADLIEIDRGVKNTVDGIELSLWSLRIKKDFKLCFSSSDLVLETSKYFITI